ncbi:ABC transporter substrate-binding protein [Litoribrevibacter albus]|uniref:Iron ABC transporter substrate-binding protein n=1 Tax=Litoribrevibacter albus TaxID=1473156 RepID=A0AA37W6M5_9GAMM|nr:ABC transporter substrate-binding protein [Litoribrevibacter albus]GLQ29576.1 iron ABC transporter substrate-binding protein [Litoribrevibacter albus]
MPRRSLKLWLACVTLLVAGFAHASIEITDIANRKITLEQPAQRIILGEGRFLAALGVLGVKQPLTRVAGMMNDFKQFDPAGYQAYQQAFPEIDQIPTFGQTSETSVSIEKILELNPEVAIFGLDGHGPGAKSKKVIDVLTAVGIKIVFIDFRKNPIEHTARSIEILGQVLGYEQNANSFSRFYQTKLAHIQDTLSGIPESAYPKVLLDVWASTKEPCCFTIAEGLFAAMARFAGGISIAEGQLPGPVGKISAEYALISNFDVYIGTSSGAQFNANPSPPSSKPSSTPTRTSERYSSLIMGAQVPNGIAQASLKQVLAHRNFDRLVPIQNGRSYALWHHFYNSPLNLYAIESMAKWFHPELFKDLDPQQTLNTLLTGFSPVDLSGTYSTEL